MNRVRSIIIWRAQKLVYEGDAGHCVKCVSFTLFHRKGSDHYTNFPPIGRDEYL